MGDVVLDSVDCSALGMVCAGVGSADKSVAQYGAKCDRQNSQVHTVAIDAILKRVNFEKAKLGDFCASVRKILKYGHFTLPFLVKLKVKRSEVLGS
jgi:hypothetical protein